MLSSIGSFSESSICHVRPVTVFIGKPLRVAVAVNCAVLPAKIEKLYVDKNFYYDNEVTFFIAVKNADGMLKAVKAISTYGDNLSLGENELAAELELPSDFNPETDKIETMVWTSF